MFHPIKGKNIKFNSNKVTATWTPVDTGGQLFSCQYLDQGRELTLDFDGSGGVELGIIDTNPNEGRQNVYGYGTDEGNYQFLNDVKIHKRSCKIHVRIDYVKQEVTSIYGTGVYTQRLKTEKPYWLVVDVKYGEVEIEIQEKEITQPMYSFSKSYGNNIEVHVNGRNARSLCKSPASLCMYKSPVKSGLKLALHGTPKPYQGTTPGRFYVRLFVTTIQPEDLRSLHRDRFDIIYEKTDNPKWTEIETFEKDNCHGTITLEFKNNCLKYRSAIGKTSEQIYMTRPEEDVWLVLELYGVSIQIEVMPDTQNDRNRGVDVPDAKALCPRNMSPNNASVEGNSQPKTSSISPSLDPNLESYVQYNPIPVSPTSGNSQPVQYPRDSNLASATDIAQSSDETVNLADGIQNNFTELLQSFTPKDHFADLLFEKRYITRQRFLEIQSGGQDTELNQTRRFLIFMMGKPIPRTLLEKALDETEQKFLLPKFLNEKEKK